MVETFDNLHHRILCLEKELDAITRRLENIVISMQLLTKDYLEENDTYAECLELV